MYSKIFWEHVQSPRNRYRGQPQAAASPEKEAPCSRITLTGSSRYQRCGDRLTLQLEITDGRISQAFFEARACAPVIAVASLGTEKIIGLTLDETRELQILEWDRHLGGLPPSKRHAYLIFLECLAEAVEFTKPSPMKG